MNTISENAYQQALDYIFNYIDFSLTHQENIAPEKFELARMRVFLKKLGDPQEQYPSIHIAGTKGKGSVSALTAGALQADGYKVGLYTSPHLHEFTERIQINRTPIPKLNFAAIVEKIKAAAEQTPGITSYEIQTAIAFLYFAQEKVDIAVLEVGLGGRLDSTNVVTPLVSVITSLSLDHTSILGNTLGEIAGEKGGIIKENISVVSAPQKKEASDVLKQIAREKKADYTELGKDILYTRESQDPEGQTLIVNDETKLKIALLGPHQAENAALAYATLNIAKKNGLLIGDEAIQQGFASTQWPGRFEILQRNPSLIFDGAHNQHSAAMLMKTLHEIFPQQSISMIFGASEDKDIEGMFQELLPYIDRLIPVSSSHPRAAKLTHLEKLAEEYPCETIIPDSIKHAFELANGKIGEKGVILVTGSLYLVGEARHIWLTSSK